MDDLGRLLRSEQDVRWGATPAPGPELVVRVSSAARRRRAIRQVGAGAVAVVAVGAIGVGAWGLSLNDRAEQLTPMESVEPSPEPTEPPTSGQSPNADPTPTFDANLPGASDDGGPDGIPESAYPPLAADRGIFYDDGVEVRHYPQAHQMKDWVWAHVGPGWSISPISMPRKYDYDPDFFLPAAVLYLVSPEGVHFDLGTLPEETWDDTRVVTWHEQSHTVRLAWISAQGDAGGLYDLRTGALDPLHMNVNGEPATHYTFIAGNAQGDELWRAESSEGFKYYRWTAREGWHASALVDNAAEADYLEENWGFLAPTLSADGNRLLLRPGPEGPQSGSTLTVIDYELGADSVSRLSFETLPAESEIYDFVVTGQGTVLANAVIEGTDTTLELTLDGTGTIERSSREFEKLTRGEYDVEYGKASSPTIGVTECSC